MYGTKKGVIPVILNVACTIYFLGQWIKLTNKRRLHYSHPELWSAELSRSCGLEARYLVTKITQFYILKNDIGAFSEFLCSPSFGAMFLGAKHLTDLSSIRPIYDSCLVVVFLLFYNPLLQIINSSWKKFYQAKVIWRSGLLSSIYLRQSAQAKGQNIIISQGQH